ncbi:MAG: hypothetical protein WDA14_11120 [Sphaerochaetaceae bacterium]|nr:hypothetical protein [Sphaerochaetaceae bacterium]MDD4260181.1 hypothetical protein [Sphaerochaetaceae bacterium]MDD4842620.1 hypothetical protein [Sphaerochaetaceae bacterium]MDX9934906.1 hypothetical protein [Sphaerochaetaceae bacterium]NLO60737.1 hypothetical protein [Spirochaetales bacterium]
MIEYSFLYAMDAISTCIDDTNQIPCIEKEIVTHKQIISTFEGLYHEK